MREVLKLTEGRVARLVSQHGKVGHHRDTEIPGLYLQVVRLGTKDRRPSASWILRFQLRGAKRMMGLGSLNDFDLEAARVRARAARAKLADGVDPLNEKQAEREQRALTEARSITFQKAAEEYIRENEPKWQSAVHRHQIRSSLERLAYPVIGAYPVADIDRPLVLKVLRPLWSDKTETASRLRGRIEDVLDWAEVSGYRTGTNPARWQGSLEHALPSPIKIMKVKHHTALPFDDLPGFMIALAGREGSAARCLEFLILTAARTSEATGATWSEIDLEAKLWTIPGERMKMDKPHIVPLSDRAVALLQALPHEAGNPHLFIGFKKGRGLSNMAMSTLVQKRMKVAVTVHGFRSTFKDWAAERTSYANEVSEMALAHAVASSVEKAYRRGDLLEKRARLMQDWADFASTKPVKADGKKVVSLRPAR